jgi:AcrR family transcriptional regulator
LPKQNETSIFVIGIVVMKGPKTKIAPRPRGRPRSEQARQEILETAYKLLRDRGFNAVGSHEIAQAAGVSSATLYRWWKSKEEILFDACFEHMRPSLAIPETGSGLTRLRRYVLRASEFLASEEGTVMARVLTGIHEDQRLRRMFLERYVNQRRQIQRAIIEASIASGELKPTTDPELLIDMLSGPLFFRWLQGHAPLDKGFAKSIFDKVIPAFQTK